MKALNKSPGLRFMECMESEEPDYGYVKRRKDAG